MAARMIFTALALVLAAVAFLGGGPGTGGPLDPFGILFLFASGLIWLGWEAIQESYSYFRDAGKTGRERPDLPIIRMGPMIIKGITAKKPPPKSSKVKNPGAALHEVVRACRFCRPFQGLPIDGEAFSGLGRSSNS